MSKNDLSIKKNERPEKITGENIILVEGKDEVKFIEAFLKTTKYKDLLDLKDGIRKIEIKSYDGNGKGKLKNHLSTLKLIDGYTKVKSILIIRDAENDYNKAVSEVKDALNQNGFNAPTNVCKKVKGSGKISIGFLLAPTYSSKLENGTLEDLCLKIINEKNKKEVNSIVNKYLIEMHKAGYTELNKKHKNLLHSYLSCKDDFVSYKLGEAASAGAFDFASNELKPLLNFIEEMIE